MILPSKFWTCTKPCLLLIGLCIFLAANAAALNEQVIYNFTNAGGGINPNTGLISDSAGNLYGGTQFTDGSLGYGPGTIFELVWNGSSYTYEMLYAFTGQADGEGVDGSLVRDTHGNLYGIADPGVGNSTGSVFELSPNEGGGWTLTVLYSFTHAAYGAFPLGGVILDQAGNLYGVTSEGGRLSDCSGFGCGVVFKLSPGSSGVWTETVLHAFAGPDGAFPSSALVWDRKGSLYGTNSAGGTSTACVVLTTGCGTVFRLSPSAGGWTARTLHSFYVTNTDGSNPLGLTYIDGNLFGVTLLGGTQNAGTVFEVTLSKSGATESVIHSFGAGTDAALPRTPVVFDKIGNLYGSATGGGNSTCGTGCGAIYELKRNGTTFKETILHEFTGGLTAPSPSGLRFSLLQAL